MNKIELPFTKDGFGVSVIIVLIVIALFFSALGIWWSIDNYNSLIDLLNPIFFLSLVVWIVFTVKMLGTLIKFRGGKN